MAQALVDLPPEVARVANQAAATGGTLLGAFTGAAGWLLPILIVVDDPSMMLKA